jgi:glyoxylase-like metal-dependent hydrolase (beta-lactamase superfamily II)
MTTRLGEFELTTISGGVFHIDGGTMFGVVPKTLWSRLIPPDDQNRIAQQTNCVLVRTGQQTVLIDTGYGSKLSEKERRIFNIAEGDPLVRNLNAKGVGVDEIDVVILSHLHFDHAGGATQISENGALRPTFPNAEYVAQRHEWVTATAGYPELRAAYPQDNLLPLQEAGQLRLIDGNAEIVPGIRAFVTGGHTQGHQAIFLESGGETAIYLGDTCPTTRHLPALWCMGYDLDILHLRRLKPDLLGQVADNDWLALFDHDPDHAAARLVRDNRRDFAVAEAFAEL